VNYKKEVISCPVRFGKRKRILVLHVFTENNKKYSYPATKYNKAQAMKLFENDTKRK